MPRARTAHKPLQPFTADHFRAYTAKLVLDTGEYWVAESFQIECVEPIMAGVPEVWTMLPQGNAKSTLMAGFALYHCDYMRAPWVPIAAASRDQAEILARQAYDIIRSSPGMPDRFKIYEGYREIRSRRNGGRGIKVYAADMTTADGVIPTLAICDEGHRHENLDLYRLWTGKLRKRGAQIVMMSTAGDPGSEFEDTLQQIRDRSTLSVHITRCHTRYEGPGLVMNEWAVPNVAEAKNMKVVKLANPLSTITEGSLQESYESLTMREATWLRYTCNIAARMDERAITELEWDDHGCEDEIPKGKPIDLGVDVAWKKDTFAMQPLYQDDGELLLGEPEVLTPPQDGSMIHPDKVKAAFKRIYERNPIEHVIMDMGRAEDIAVWMEDEYSVTVVDRPQGNANAAEDYVDFMEALRNDVLWHTGSTTLKAHVMHAIARALPNDKMRFDRPSQSRAKAKRSYRVIDCLTAAAMVVNFVMHPPEDDDKSGFQYSGDVEDYRIMSLSDA